MVYAPVRQQRNLIDLLSRAAYSRKQEENLTKQHPASIAPRLRFRAGLGHCPYCREAFRGGDAQRVCTGCETAYHRACLAPDELERCGTLGCPGGSVTVRQAPRQDDPVGLLRLVGASFLVLAALTVPQADEVVGMFVFLLAVVGMVGLVAGGSSRPAPTPRRTRPAPTPPKPRRCLLCPRETEEPGQTYCAAHRSLLEDSTGYSRGAGSPNPGQLFGPGLIDRGDRGLPG